MLDLPTPATRRIEPSTARVAQPKARMTTDEMLLSETASAEGPAEPIELEMPAGARLGNAECRILTRPSLRRSASRLHPVLRNRRSHEVCRPR
jgi:hypothetical protein